MLPLEGSGPIALPWLCSSRWVKLVAVCFLDDLGEVVACGARSYARTQVRVTQRMHAVRVRRVGTVAYCARDDLDPCTQPCQNLATSAWQGPCH